LSKFIHLFILVDSPPFTYLPLAPSMTIDKSLRIRRGSVKSRNVLKRGERIARLKEAERWEETMTVLGLPKVKVIRLTMKKKKKKKEEEAGAEGAAAAPGAAAPAAGAKGTAAPAKGAAPAKAAAAPAKGAAKK
jgi:small basic protein (TIGR04137 family)